MTGTRVGITRLSFDLIGAGVIQRPLVTTDRIHP